VEFALPFPKSREEIARIQRVRKRNAFELAKTATWYRGKLDHIDPDKLDDKEVWESIPILDKDVLRKFSHGDFLDNLCIVPNGEIAEYWRSGGSTGQPVFYPRNKDDVRYASCRGGVPFRASASGRATCATFLSRWASIPPGRFGRAARACSTSAWCGLAQEIRIRRSRSST
jgi:phenylacetate-CoA ligase